MVIQRLRALVPHYVPTRRLVAVIVATSPVWLFSESNTGALIALATLGLLILIIAADALFTPDRSDVEIKRSLAPHVGVGEEIVGTYSITSRVQRSVRVEIYDAIPQAMDHTMGQRAVRLPPCGVATITIRVTGRTRGVYMLGPVALRVSGPLDLIRRTVIYPMEDQVVVMPSVSGARGYRLQAMQRRTRIAGARTLRLRGMSTMFAGLRDYTPGDDPRHMDWKATARRGRLTSREFTVEQGQILVIAIDAGRLMTQYAGDRPRFEYALSSALLLADVALAAGDRVGLIVFNDEVRAYVAPGRGAGVRRELRATLTAATATMTEPDYAAAFRTLAARQRRRSLIVLFTDVIDPRSSGAVIAHTVRSAQRHLPLVVALRNEQLSTASLPTPEATLDTLYDAVAVEELLLARTDALERMRQRGVSVLDTPPRMMTAAVINRYLELKDRAAL